PPAEADRAAILVFRFNVVAGGPGSLAERSAKEARAVEVAVIHEHWASGQARRAGWAIYQAIPGRLRPGWAADILELSCSRLAAVPDPVRAVAEIGRDPQRWPEAYAAFSAVRKLTLAEERSHAGGVVYELVLFVAENVAKVVYNASGEPAPFDYDCGYWLV